ncbi:aspartate carbamoyltransferase [Ramlibacter sp.]|uniref:aspartate carbamoyltransferase n=1 Tax=Ramlibacter sp. TaxID=1917967 RepID=UPI002C4D6EA1|nr:aspartate carbamoyltransferase [Ramlibacter sp.]HWI81171.1 aspartate carbamoyltransferase [Ramlibacter sp.]
MKKPALILSLTLLAAVGAVHAADAARQADVARRGADVMPFSLAATRHVFTKTAAGGLQRVVARRASDAQQVQLVRAHLREIEARFRQGDFSGPAHIHGEDMPGLAQLGAARPGAVAIGYKDVPGGAELAYRTDDPALVAALHSWFDAQLSDHGRDAMAGQHGQHGMHGQ